MHEMVIKGAFVFTSKHTFIALLVTKVLENVWVIQTLDIFLKWKIDQIKLKFLLALGLPCFPTARYEEYKPGQIIRLDD